MGTIAEFSRGEKHDVTRDTIKRLIARKDKGPDEPALDGFIPQFQVVLVGLDTGVEGKAVTNATRIAQLARLEEADSNVDTSLRHHYHFLNNEALRKIGPYIILAAALRDAALPDGLEPLNDYIPDENRVCRDAISILRTEPHKTTAKNIKLPEQWTMQWEAELDESDAAFEEVRKAREATSANVVTGLDAETEFVDVAVRYRRYVSSRASRSDKAKIAEGVELLAPINEALAKAKAEAAARATRRKTAAKEAAAPAAKGAAPAAKDAAPAAKDAAPAPAGSPGTKDPK